MNGHIARAGHMFAFFSRIGTAEPTTAAKQGTISRETDGQSHPRIPSQSDGHKTKYD